MPLILDDTTTMEPLDAIDGIDTSLPMDIPLAVDAMHVDLNGVDIFGDPLHAPSKRLRQRMEDLRRPSCCT
jgi:hypothetical protein